jgi:hypothetical protein
MYYKKLISSKTLAEVYVNQLYESYNLLLTTKMESL